MQSRFRANPGRRRWTWALLASAVAAAMVGGFELYRVVVPFEPKNPLWREATIGERVIDNWQYEGLNEEGYLKFYNEGQTVLLPPSAHLFGADGKFVVIEEYSPNSLTFAEPYDAVPLSWILAAMLTVAPGIWLLVRRLRRRTLQRFRTPAGVGRRPINRGFAAGGGRRAEWVGKPSRPWRRPALFGLRRRIVARRPSHAPGRFRPKPGRRR
ncbi:MAG: hypothetical protein IRZ33_00660 [Alicyclobacillaceae bacterium]|nr:hypothetical protein [Alicyclobacillaceae bacterium]